MELPLDLVLKGVEPLPLEDVGEAPLDAAVAVAQAVVDLAQTEDHRTHWGCSGDQRHDDSGPLHRI
jgi:hypothetical protein